MKPLVSICCITYNHEKYIADALESFLMQETSFPYEIVVHDDASSDNTANIIREYENKYPHIIKAIYQKENQFSKGKKITFECVLPQVKGPYVAFCEGDDYWCDKNKIQSQVDFLSKYEEYSACFHGVEVVDINGNFLGKYLGPAGRGNKDYAMKDNIVGGFLHISSLMTRSEILINKIPNWALQSTHSDYALALIVSANGKVRFIDDIMSAHRYGVENSVMTKLREEYSKAREIDFHKKIIRTFDEANAFYNYIFDEDIKIVNRHSEVRILLLNNKFRELFSSKYRNYFSAKGFVGTVKLIILTKTPSIARNFSYLKGKLRLVFTHLKNFKSMSTFLLR